jgi:hypothetical protein
MATNLVIGLVVVVLLIRRQLRVRRVVSDKPMTGLLILAAVGVAQVLDAWHRQQPTALGIGLLAVSLALAAAFGFWRAATVKIWATQDGLVQQGSAATAALWVLAVVVHVAVDLLGDRLEPAHSAAATSVSSTLSASIVVYLAVSFGVQRLVVAQRVRRLRPLPDLSA